MVSRHRQVLTNLNAFAFQTLSDELVRLTVLELGNL
jgi:hypothetical protein